MSIVSIRIYGLKCSSCGFVAVLDDDDPSFLDIPLQSMKCPKCDSVTVSYDTASEHAVAHGEEGPVRLSAADMRRAFTGFGLPGENALSENILRELLVNVGVWSVDFDTSPQDRVLIRSMTFNNGKKVWLAPSGLGVAALKITTGEKDG